MAPGTELLQDLAVVTGAAALTGLVFRRFKLPGLFGFLTAGLLIGPHSFGIVKGEESLQTLSDLGVVLLLFGLGLTFNLRQLRRVGGVAFVVTLTQGLLMLWLGFELGRLIGWSTFDNLFLGAMLSISSTTITLKVLTDLGRLHTESSRIIFGVLVLQDVAAVLVLVLLSGYGRTGGVELAQVARIGAEMVLFLVSTILLGLILVPRLVDYVGRRYGNEILVLTSLGLAFGMAVLSDLAGFHVGLGAFLMGALVAEAKARERVEHQVRPVADLFAAVFFVTIGTLVDPQQLVVYWKPLIAVFLLIVVGKLASGSIATFLMGYAPATSIAVGAGLAQVGEFSFVIAALGQDIGITSDFLVPLIVGASALSSLAASIAMRFTDPIHRFVGRIAPASMRTYARIYVAWMGSLRERPGLAQRARRIQARRGAILSLLLLGAALGSAWFLQAPGKGLLARQGLRDPSLTLTYWGLVLAALLPLLFRFFHTANRWLDTWQLPEHMARKGTTGFRRTVRITFYLLGTILLGLPMLAATAPFLNTPVVALAWVGMVASAAVILWASINRLHVRIESNVQALLDDEHLPVHAPQIVRDLMTVDFPWELRVETLELDAYTWATGKRLGEIELRSATGASLILIERGDQRQEAPGPDTLLLPGDRLTLIGSREQLASAHAVLSRPAPAGPSHTELRLGRLYVSESSELDGARLSDAALPTRSGLQVVAILRANQAIPNPGAHERLQPGDVILVLGGQEQIAAATSLVGPKATPGSGGGATP